MTIVTEQLGVAVGGEWLFKSLDLSVNPGECLAVTGTNGSGKSTLLGCLYGTRMPSEGSVTVGGKQPDEHSPAFRRRVSVLLEDSALFDELSPRQHLHLLRTFPGARPEPDDLLAWAGLDHRADVPAGQLSAGQRRRLLLLGCIARPHEVLLLDEPERALDAAGREWLTELVRGSLAAGAAVVVVSHHDPLVDAVAAAVVRLS
ncbi:ABC transporter ATP-binding protein [Amycolatopsis viridis]|uniref:ABC-type multidrug transport system ATPase subunit n=1 Tax=Amycolatopsis viridis TaxID=185678 RepID=A0ABX0SYR8_9PSEU|nr:ABC transporter ATP-binding protein [Amycolatopsis viridis]NIH82113.1 ABC-type multidrug transport system ATPase subunit [Amycolatopsis viridis]